MLKFIVFKDGQPAADLDVKSAFLMGQEDVPVKSQIRYVDRLLVCQKGTEEAAAVVIFWEVKGCGKYLLQTTRLPDRDKPYILNVELVRWRLMRILQKLEDWGLFDYPQTEQIAELLEQSKKLFVLALQNEHAPAKAADLADQALEKAMEAGEALAKFHALRMLIPRLQAGNFTRKLFGCRINPGLTADNISQNVLDTLNFVQIPLCWADLQPTRQQFNLAPLDRWLEFFLKRKMSVKFGSVINFSEAKIPAWLKGKSMEFESLRDIVYEFLTAVANRYGKFVRSWTILGGPNADNYFGLNFEQILDITRLVATRAKQLCPRATSVIEITYPWGEYYARNPRTIYPFLYADMVAQSGINFDAFALRMPFGAAKEGLYTRDFFQISSMIDRFAMLGKPLHLITGAPSQMPDDPREDPGYWNSPWSPEVQARWFESFCHMALSKPQVESIAWEALSDNFSKTIPYGGLIASDWSEKPIFGLIREIQKRFIEAKTNLRSDKS